MNRSEEIVYELTQRACLRLWTFLGPQGKEPGKELCDVLVACDPDVIVISVKEIELKRDAAGMPTATDRWRRRAVDESVHQVYGAARRLTVVDAVTPADGRRGIRLPSADTRRIHRIAVAIGGDDAIPLESRDYGQGFVHVFGPAMLLTLLLELDTITDLIEYLVEREQLLEMDATATLVANEADILALFIANLHSFALLFEEKRDLTVLDGLWEAFVASAEYARRAEANRISYAWDELIEVIHEQLLRGDQEQDEQRLDQVERTTRLMAREDRTSRRFLGGMFDDFLRGDLRSRICNSSAGATYVFLKTPLADDAELREKELTLRAVVAKGEMHKRGRPGPVVGIACAIGDHWDSFSVTTLLWEISQWTDEDAALSELIRSRARYFNEVGTHEVDPAEFPRPGADG